MFHINHMVRNTYIAKCPITIVFQPLLVIPRSYLLEGIINKLLFSSIVGCRIAGSKRTSVDERVPTSSCSGPILKFHLY